MRIQSVKSNRQNMHLPRKFLPLVWFILQRPPFFARKNGRIGTASDSLNKQFQTEWNSFKQDLKKTAAIFLKCDADEVRTRGLSVSSQALYH